MACNVTITVTDMRIALSDTCMGLLRPLDEEETRYETERRRAGGS
jgi:hypothetical protein